MKRFVKHAVTALFMAVACQTGFVLDTTASAADAAPSASYIENSLCESQCEPDIGYSNEYNGYVLAATKPCPTWTIDYRILRLADSNTSYQFGTPQVNGGWAPLSKLDWSLDSTWQGFNIGFEKPNWTIHFEWLTPMGSEIDGDMADFDWNIDPPQNDPNRLDSHTLSSLRWNDGHMIDLEWKFKWENAQTEIWPMLGFRFQRFDMTASGINYLVPAYGPLPQYDGVDVITFNQQYYQLYLGGQIRRTVCCMGMSIDLTFQGDWAATWGYNIDHHLLRAGGDRFTMENTGGDAYHLGLTAETTLIGRFSLGLQVDHMQIRTTGTHRMDWQSQGYDITWTNGVLVKSRQTSFTAFLRASF